MNTTIPLPDLYKHIRGHFNFESVYDEAVAGAPDNAVFVEIGSYLGQSAAYLASRIMMAKKNIKVLCIDFWREMDVPFQCNYYDFLKNVEPFKEVLIPIRLKSLDAVKLFADQSFDFVFIDGDHTYDGVKADIAAWSPKLKPTGLLAGHDYTPVGHPDTSFEGVGRAVREAFGENGIRVIHNTWIRK